MKLTPQVTSVEKSLKTLERVRTLNGETRAVICAECKDQSGFLTEQGWRPCRPCEIRRQQEAAKKIATKRKNVKEERF